MKAHTAISLHSIRRAVSGESEELISRLRPLVHEVTESYIAQPALDGLPIDRKAAMLAGEHAIVPAAKRFMEHARYTQFRFEDYVRYAIRQAIVAYIARQLRSRLPE